MSTQTDSCLQWLRAGDAYFRLIDLMFRAVKRSSVLKYLDTSIASCTQDALIQIQNCSFSKTNKILWSISHGVEKQIQRLLLQRIVLQYFEVNNTCNGANVCLECTDNPNALFCMFILLHLIQVH